MIRGVKRPTLKSQRVVHANIHNRFDVEVIDARTGKTKQKAVGHNVICDQLWSRFAAKSAWFNYIQYGVGSGTPSVSDTKLFSYSGHKPVSTDNTPDLDRKNCTASLTRNIQLSDTEAVGLTITEVGIAYSTGSSTLVTHAMLKDMNGNPISIEKTGTDILNIYATVYVHWPEDYLSITNPVRIIPDYYNFGSYLYGIVRWLLGVQSSAPGLAFLSTNMAAKYLGSSECSNASSMVFDATTRKATITFNRFPVSAGNLPHGAHGVVISQTYATGSGTVGPCLYFSGEWFGGSDIIGESVGTGDGETVDFATMFDLPTNAVVYVDGVPAEVAVEEVPLDSSRMQSYFDMVVVEDGRAYPTWNVLDGTSKCYSSSGADYLYRISGGTYYNKYYQHGVRRLVNVDGNDIPLSVSDDLLTWTDLGTFDSSGMDVPEEYWYSKYWQFGLGSRCNVKTAEAVSLTGKNIHFEEPPPQGSVITIDYHTPVIAKDTNHVFDLTVTIQLGEYTEAQ